MAELLLDYRTRFVASEMFGAALLMLLMQTRKPYPGLVRVAINLEVPSAAISVGSLTRQAAAGVRNSSKHWLLHLRVNRLCLGFSSDPAHRPMVANPATRLSHAEE